MLVLYVHGSGSNKLNIGGPCYKKKFTPLNHQYVEVLEKNNKVEDGPALINQSPEAEGWLCRFIISYKNNKI